MKNKKFILFWRKLYKVFKIKRKKNQNKKQKKIIIFKEFIKELYNYYEEYEIKTNQIDLEYMIKKAKWNNKKQKNKI